MSTPVRGADGPLGYAPRWARTAESVRDDTALHAKLRTPTLAQESPEDFRPPLVVMPLRETVSPQEVVPFEDVGSEPKAAAAREPASHRDGRLPGASGTQQAPARDSVWKRKKRRLVFEDDVATRELRSCLASAPDQAPSRLLYPAKTSIFATVGRLVSVMILAAAGTLGFLWITAPRGAPPQLASNPGGGEVASLASYPPQKPPSATVPPSAAPWAMANYTRDATDGVNALPAAPAIPAAPRTPASRVTVPPPTTPTPAAAATAAPPFPAPPAPASRAAVRAVTAPVAVPDDDEVAGLLARGRAYLSEGDVALARLYLRRAAERYDPQAALALGGTYDPAELRRIGIPNSQAQADPAKAREWYRRAADLGSAAAALRLERLP